MKIRAGDWVQVRDAEEIQLIVGRSFRER